MKTMRMGERFIMDIKQYQQYVKDGMRPIYQDTQFAVLALVGEVGEVCDLIKKKSIYSEMTIDLVEKLKDELGDVIWQWMACVNSLGLTAEGVIEDNVAKLNARHGGATTDLTGGKR